MSKAADRDAIHASRQESGKHHWDYIPGIYRKRFVSPYEQYRHRVGQTFTVLSVLEKAGEEVYDDEGNVTDHLNMYRIRFADGTEIDAWAEEICMPPDVQIAVTKRELATVLAALRQWQMDWEANPDELRDSIHFEGSIEPLSSVELDQLCERLNYNPLSEGERRE